MPLRVGDLSVSDHAASDFGIGREPLTRRVLDSLSAFVGVLECDGTLIEANRLPLEMAGLSPAEVIGQKVWDTYWWNYSTEVQEQLRRACRRALSGEIVRYDVQVRMAGGHLIWIDFQIAPLRDDTGRITHLVPSAMDVTQRKQMEDTLREREARFRALFSAIDEGYCLCEIILDDAGKPVDYRFIEVNPLFETMTGLVDAVGRTVRELVPDLEAHWFETYGKVALRGEVVRFESRSVAMGRDFDCFSAPADPPGRFVVVFKDVTARKRAEEALRRSEERYRGIYEYAVTGIVITDLDGWYVACNPAYAAILGYPEEELRRLRFSDLVHPDDRDENVAQIELLRDQKITSFDISNRSLRKDGRTVWLQKHVTVLRDADGAPTDILALVTDVTERKRFEEHTQLLMREINHRSKNMLSLVQAVARQTAASNAGDFVTRFSERIRSLAASQDLLVKNEWRGVDLNELATSQLEHFFDLIGDRISIRGPQLALLVAAAQTIGMALHELATNAGKYGALSNDAGRVGIAWRLYENDAGENRFAIRWCERGGPPVTQPDRRGFGSTVVSVMTKLSLEAEVSLDWAAEGLTWALDCPAENITDVHSALSTGRVDRS